MTDIAVLLKAYRHMCTTVQMARLYEANRAVCKYVHSTSLGHQAIQLATAYQLQPCDWVSPYYRDESMLLGIGYSPAQLMLQLLARDGDPFSAGRSYYSHPSSLQANMPRIMHQSSATGMQVIPATGLAEGIKYLHQIRWEPLLLPADGGMPVVVCSLGDASITEGEVSEAFQVAALKKLPILYLVQDNGWGISVTAAEARAMDAVQFANGYPGLHAVRVDGADFDACFQLIGEWIGKIRQGGGPCVIQAKVPLLGHHTSGVRKEFYRDAEELQEAELQNPVMRLRTRLLELGIPAQELGKIESEGQHLAETHFAEAQRAPEPSPASVTHHIFAPTSVSQEQGERSPAGAAPVIMVDAAMFAIREIMEDHPEAILYGQDVGKRLGGVFREAATLGERFGDHRVYNTAIQEAYIVGSTAGMSAAGVKPIVEIQFADYVYPGINQLVTELSKSCYLSAGKFPIQALIRIPCGAYGGGGPYHSGSIESTLLSIKGIKVVYPSNAADMKGLMKAAFYDPNPVIMLEHKGLYWSKLPHTEAARCPEPSRDYMVPLGKGRIVQKADNLLVTQGDSCCVITYGMGVYWALAASKALPGKVEILDLRTLFPLDEVLMYETVRKHGKCLVLTEEQQGHSYAESLAGRIQQHCFHWLDAPVQVLGALDLPAVPINLQLEAAMLPNPEKVLARLQQLLSY